MAIKFSKEQLTSKQYFLTHISGIESSEAAMFGPFGKGDGPVTVICYGKRDEYRSRLAAKMFFMLGMECCGGSERDRYTDIYLALEAGEKVCTDGEPERKRKIQ